MARSAVSSVSEDAPDLFRVTGVPVLRRGSAGRDACGGRAAATALSGTMRGSSGSVAVPAADAAFALRHSRKPPPSTISLLGAQQANRRRIPGSVESRHAQAMAANPRAFAKRMGMAEKHVDTMARTRGIVPPFQGHMRLSALADALPYCRPASRPAFPRGSSGVNPATEDGNVVTWAAEEERLEMIRRLIDEESGPRAGTRGRRWARKTKTPLRRHASFRRQGLVATGDGTQLPRSGGMFDPSPGLLHTTPGSPDRAAFESRRRYSRSAVDVADLAGRRRTLDSAPASLGATLGFASLGDTTSDTDARPGGIVESIDGRIGFRLAVPERPPLLRTGFSDAAATSTSGGGGSGPSMGGGGYLKLPGQVTGYVRGARTPITEQVGRGALSPVQVLRADVASGSDPQWRRTEEASSAKAKQFGRSHVARALMQSRAVCRGETDSGARDLGGGFFLHGAWVQSSSNGLPFSPLRDSPATWSGTFAGAESTRADVAVAGTPLNRASRMAHGGEPMPEAGGVRLSTTLTREQHRRQSMTAGRRELDLDRTARSAMLAREPHVTLVHGQDRRRSPRDPTSDVVESQLGTFEATHLRPFIGDFTKAELEAMLLEHSERIGFVVDPEQVRRHRIPKAKLIRAALTLGIGPEEDARMIVV